MFSRPVIYEELSSSQLDLTSALLNLRDERRNAEGNEDDEEDIPEVVII
jgi:hypothetical protein